MSPVAVVAIGGNSLIRDKQHQSVPDQFECARVTVAHLVDMIVQGWEIVVTHGNGPQVGFILLRSELAQHVLHQDPLDSCVADTQGSLGYMIQQQFYNEFRRRGLAKQAVTVVTQALVDASDEAFQHPTKPIGPHYDEAQARAYARDRGWDVMEDAGRGWRRVVPSPLPQQIIELEAIRALVAQGFVVIGVGGGGVPVVSTPQGGLRGVAAVIDKDYASGLLASSLRADLFLISTAVEKVALNYGRREQQDLDQMTLAEAEAYLQAGHFPAGSMGPKIRAAMRFVRETGQRALITAPEHIGRALRGETGTWIAP